MLLSLAAYQDYLWFIAACMWATVAALAHWGRTPERSALAADASWVVVLALAGVGLSAAELLLFVLERPFFANPRWGDDALVSLFLATMLAAAGWGAARLQPPRQRWLWAVAIAGAEASRAFDPLTGSLVLGVVAGGIAWQLGVRFRPAGAATGPAAFLRWLPLIALPLLSTTGPVAELAGAARRWHRVSALGTPAAAASLALAAVVVWLLVRALRESVVVSGLSQRHELRRIGVILSLWLAGGLLFADWSGQQSRKLYESSLLAQARMGVALLDPVRIEKCQDRALKLVNFKTLRSNDGIQHFLADAPYLSQSNTQSLRQTLTAIRKAAEQASWVQLITLRSGYLIVYAYDTRIPLETGKVVILRRAESADLEAWADRRAQVEGPISQSDQILLATAPIKTADGRMLGWLGAAYSMNRWAQAQALVRLQAFGLVGAGAGLALLAMFGRWRNQERLRAVAEAQSARAADQVKTVFLAKVSHELRTPVQNILGYSELLLRGATEPGVRQHLQSVLAQGQMLVRLINDLLDLSAIQAGAFRLNRRPFDLVTLAREITASQQPLAQARGLVLRFVTEGALPAEVVGDVDRVRQVLGNLLGNALKYTVTGSVTVTVRGEPEPAGGWRCALVVADTGPGIDAEDIGRLFRPFGRLEPTAGIVSGTGLGLALTRALCEAMGGGVAVESVIDVGSVFTATLTFGAEAAPAPAAVPEPVLPPALRVLVAEDNTLVRELFQAWLVEAGVTVETAADGLEACERVAVQVPDVLVIDLSMPWLGGLEAARRLRAEGHDSARLHIVGVSAHASPADREAALQAGMDAFIVKPVDRGTLLAAVAGVATGPEVSGGRHVLQHRLIELYCQEAPGQLAELSAAVTQLDFPAVVRLAHLLRNSADVLGDQEFGRACARLETLARDSVQPLGPALDRVDAAARRHLVSLSAPQID